MNFFLKSRNDIENATKYLQDNGLIESGISAKNWEISEVVPYFRDGNWIDLGSDGGVVLENLVKKNIKGVKVGIDLAYADNMSLNGIDIIKGDLLNVPYPDGFFNFITSLSVLEHDVDFEKFAKECSRLLAKGGQLFLSFDSWTPRPDTSKMRLYSLSWKILDKADIINLVAVMKENGLEITGDIDWTLGDAVINDAYCSPCPGISYTFCILSFIKA